MTDLEMTRLCAEAMGLKQIGANNSLFPQAIVVTEPSLHVYAPLHDDAQAMAIQKKFGLEIRTEWHNPGKSTAKLKAWIAYSVDEWASDASLNRAIVECVAKMQGAKNV